MTPLIIIITFHFIIFGKVIIDQYLINEIKEPINHEVEMIVVIFITIFHGIFIADVHTPKNWVPDDYTLAVLLFYPSSYWWWFDGLLNLFIHRKWFSIGSTAATDKFFQRTGKPMYITSKIAAFILMVVCIVIIFQEFK